MVQRKDKNKNHNVLGKLKHLNKYGMKNKIYTKYLQACHAYLTKIVSEYMA